MAGETVNYYYLGHLLLALPGHALSLGPETSPTTSRVAGLFALSASAVFTLAGTLWAATRDPRRRADPSGSAWRRSRCAWCSATSRARASGCGPTSPPGGYDWFSVSRVIPDTINEFPSFSFTLGDLHAHLLAIPFTLLALAFALQVALDGPRGDLAWRAVAEALTAGLAVGALYAINSWSYPLAAGLLIAAVVIWMRGPSADGRRAFGAVWTVLVLLAGFVLVLPFWLELRPRRARDRLGRRAALLQRLGGRHDADLRRARVGGGGRLRRAAAGRAPAREDRGLGRRRRAVRALAAGPRRPLGVALLLALLGVAIHAALSRRLRGAGALPLAARRGAASRACSRPSSSTCATSSTAATCSA